MRPEPSNVIFFANLLKHCEPCDCQFGRYRDWVYCTVKYVTSSLAVGVATTGTHSTCRGGMAKLSWPGLSIKSIHSIVFCVIYSEISTDHLVKIRQVSKLLQEVVRVAEADMQQESCAVFLEILEHGLMPVHNYTETFLQTILMCMDNKDPGCTTVSDVLCFCIHID